MEGGFFFISGRGGAGTFKVMTALGLGKGGADTGGGDFSLGGGGAAKNGEGAVEAGGAPVVCNRE
jgi:hypothetical protein